MLWMTSDLPIVACSTSSLDIVVLGSRHSQVWAMDTHVLDQDISAREGLGAAWTGKRSLVAVYELSVSLPSDEESWQIQTN